eukprot:tig00000169_g11891.t1
MHQHRALVLAAGAAAAAVWAWWRSRISSLEASTGAPVIRVGWPIIGTARAFRKDPLKLLREAREAYPDAGGVSLDLLAMQLTVVWGEEEVVAYHKSPRPVLSTRPFIDRNWEPVFGPRSEAARAHQYGASGHESEDFKYISRAVSRPQLEAFLPVELRVAAEEVARWAAAPCFEAYEAASRLVMRANVLFFLGPAFEPHVDRIAETFLRLEQTAVSPQMWVGGLARRRAARLQRRLATIFTGVWRSAGIRPAQEGLGGFLAHFPDFYEEKDFVHILIGMLFGAHTTTAGTLSWLLASLAQHPERAARLAAEQAAIVAARGPALDLAALDEAPLLGRHFKEVVRLHTVPLTVRVAAQPCTLGRYRIPAGRHVASSPLISNSDPATFEDPLAFAPERWERPDATPAGLERYRQNLFGHGFHQCLGEKYATYLIKLVAAYVLRRYDVRFAEGAGPVPPPQADVLLGSQYASGPIRLALVPRSYS